MWKRYLVSIEIGSVCQTTIARRGSLPVSPVYNLRPSQLSAATLVINEGHVTGTDKEERAKEMFVICMENILC